MHPAFSVIFLTTLIGAGQGLYLVAFGAETLARAGLLAAPGERFQITAGVVSLLLMVAGLGASFGHLGRPERAWRAAAKWRTSWLSREVIALPLCMFFALAWAVLHAWRPESGALADPLAVWGIGALGALAMLALFVITAMNYACMKFIEEWASAWTVVNYTLLGCASGATLATALAAVGGGTLVRSLAVAALALTGIALLARTAALERNARLKHKSTLQSAIGVRHTKITQRAMGMSGGAFNTREFFHGKPATVVVAVRLAFLVLTFPAAAALLYLALGRSGGTMLALLLLAFVVQYIGLVLERWYFFAEARHPQNLYYQTVG